MLEGKALKKKKIKETEETPKEIGRERAVRNGQRGYTHLADDARFIEAASFPRPYSSTCNLEERDLGIVSRLSILHTQQPRLSPTLLLVFPTIDAPVEAGIDALRTEEI